MYAIVDIETTGGQPAQHELIEIAVVIHDGIQIIHSFQSLVNPQIPIPSYISGLTGITNEMVADAPTFDKIAKQILELTDNKIFVAHNAHFDYTFLQTKFKNLGYAFERAHLCTIRLSRKIFPGLRKYNLGAICQHLKIPIENRHRALGDAQATALLFSKLLESVPYQEILKELESFAQKFYFPPSIPEEKILQIPQSTGIYFFHDVQGNIVYVGKANNLQERIKQHFSKGSPTQQDPLMISEIYDISFEETGHELIALLRECEEIQKMYPKYNRALKNSFLGYGIFQYQDQLGYNRLSINKLSRSNHCAPMFYFDSESACRAFLKKLSEEHKLCAKMIGLHSTSTTCYDYDKGNCLGACCKKESAFAHNKRLTIALLSFQKESFLLKGKGRNQSEASWIWIDKGVYKGFCFINKQLSIPHYQIIQNIPTKPYSAEANKILESYLKLHEHEFEKIHL
ncbi:MAG: exonuclease domain-containing protein [Cytophagales bacterium]|nr:exonuclease domain-containing protein [Cytophagales bacterium]MDW8383315.1 exonuclease domain-containing protein [Flammeovirgaceae bacterium]